MSLQQSVKTTIHLHSQRTSTLCNHAMIQLFCRVFGKLRPRKRRPKTSKTKTSKTKTSKTKTSKTKTSKTKTSKTKTSKAKTLKPEFLRIFAISTLYRKLYLLFNVSMLCSSFHHAGKNLIEIASDGSSF